MSTEIEQRVVQMKFDNKQFESGTKTTMSTLDKLKEKLKFNNITDGFGKITQSAKNVDLSSISSGAEKVGIKFSALQTIAMTALSNITNSAVDAGKKLLSAFTIDPIKTGFQEYETQIGAIQTILANTKSKGSTLDDVNKALDELNTYADKTIYNFTEMTKNIGTFTAAGVDLATSTGAIKGIANLGAISGSTSQQVSSAMYQLSQALAAGKVSLADWNSVVNAGMGGEIFQEELKATARHFGIDVDGMIAKYGTFRESLTEGAWLTTDVLTATLQKFTGDLNKEQLMAQGYTEQEAQRIVELGQMANAAATEVKTFSQLIDTTKEAVQSGWTQTWEYIIGDFEEAKALFTGISNALGDIIQKSADRRNNMLAEWKNLGGRTDLIKGFTNIATNLGNILGSIGKAWDKVFPPMTGARLAEITKAFANFTEKIKWSPKALEGVQKAFQGIFSVIKMVVKVLSQPLKLIPSLLSLFSALGEIVFKVGGFFGNLVSSILGFTSEIGLVESVTNGIIWVLDKIIDKIHEFADWINLPMDFNSLKAAIPPLETIAKKATELRDKVVDMGKKVIDTFKNLDLSVVKSKFGETVETVKNHTKDIVADIKGKSNEIKSQTKTLGGVIVEWGRTVKDKFGEQIEILQEKFGKMVDTVKNFVKNIDWMEVIHLLGGLVAGKFFLNIGSFLKNVGQALKTFSEQVSPFKDIADSVKDALDGVKDSLSSWQKNLKASTLLKLAGAIGMIAASVWLLSTIEVDKLIYALSGIGAMFVALTTSMILMTKFGGKGLKGVFSFAAAILVLAQAVKSLSDMDVDKMKVGMVGISVLLAEMTAVSLLMKKMDGKGSIKLIALATSILILGQAVKSLGDLKWEEITKGLTSVGILLGELAAFSHLVKNSGMISSATGILILSTALLAMIAPIKVMSMLKWNTIVDGLMKIGLTLGTLTLGLMAMPSNLPAIGFGLMEVSTALIIMSGALKMMGNLDNVSQSLGVLAGSLGILVLALNGCKGTLAGSAALLVAATSLISLSTAMTILSALDWKGVAVSLAALGGSLLILVGAVWALTPVAPTLLALSGTMLAFSATLAICSAGLVLMGAGLSTIAAAFVTFGAISGPAIQNVINLFKGIGQAIIDMIPALVTAAGQAIIALVKVIGDGAPVLVEAFVKTLLAVLDGLKQVIPALADTIVTVLDEVLKSVASKIQPITESLVKILIGVMRGLSLHLPEFIQEAINLIEALLVGIFDAVNNLDWSTIGEMCIGAAIFGVFCGICSALVPAIPGAMAGLLGFGLLVAEAATIIAAIGGLAQIPGFKWLLGEGGNALQLIGVAIGKFFGGIAGGVVAGATSTLPEVGKSLSGFMENARAFFDGCEGIDNSLLVSVETLVKAVTMLTAGSLIDAIVQFLSGESSLVRFGKQLAEFAPYYRQYADAMRGVNGDTLVSTSNAVKTLVEFVKMVPRKSELADALLGERNITAFGQELCNFAPYIRRYASIMTGFNAEAVTASANAAKTLCEFAKIVPNKGGLVALLTGDNTLSDFAQDLVKFGPAIKKYSTSVTGLNVEAIQSSVTATKAILEIAKLVPNQGGFISWIVGDNTLTKMAENLADYGPALKNYSNSVTGVSVSTVQTSVDASRILVNLMKDLPKKFKLDNFGDNIQDFGKRFRKFYDSISDIAPDVLNSAVNSIKKIVALVKDLEGVDVALLSEFTNGLGNVATDAVNRFVETFNNSSGIAVQAVNGFIGSASKAITSQSSSFTQAGYALMNSLINAIRSKAPEVTNSVKMAVSGCPAAITTYRTQFNYAGITVMTSLINGISSQKSKLINAVTDLIKAAISHSTNQGKQFKNVGESMMNGMLSGIKSRESMIINQIKNMINVMRNSIGNSSASFGNAGISLMNAFASGLSSGGRNAYSICNRAAANAKSGLTGYYNSFYSAGAYLMQGFANGISSNSYRAAAAAANAARAADRAARNALGIHSPSKVGEEIGKYFDMGIANGMNKYTDPITGKAITIATRMKDALKEALSTLPSLLDDDMHLNPVITPVMDLSNIPGSDLSIDTDVVTNRARRMASLFNTNSQNDLSGVSGTLNEENVEALLGSVVCLLTDIKNKDSNVYMDSKKVGKAMANPIDNELSFNSRKRW